MKAFFYCEEFGSTKRFCMRMHDDIYNTIGGIDRMGSFAIVPARVLGISYPNYLRYVREKYNATLMKNGNFITYFFKDKKDGDKLALELSKRWNKVFC